jgi:hypothetical protein
VAYDAGTWDADTDAATKNALRDKFVTSDAAVALNTTHRGSDGSDHSFVDQDVTVAASPAFAGVDLVNLVLEFSTDTTFAGDSDSAVPTEKAVKAYVDARAGAGTGNIVWRHIRTDFS